MAVPSMIDFWKTGPGVPASPNDFITFNAGLVDAKINTTTGDVTDGFGHSSIVQADVDGGLQIENCKQVWLVMAASLANNNFPMFQHAVKVCQFILSFRNNATVNGKPYTGPTGSFPAEKLGNQSKQSRFHNKNMGMYTVAFILLLAKMSPFYVGADKTLVDSLIVQARDYTNWMSDESSGSSNINNFFGRDSPANQLMSAAGYLQMAGQLHGDPAIVDQAKRRMQQIFDNNVGNDPSNILQYGVFYEKVTKDGIGFDASYMGFSLQNLANHVWLEPAGPQQDLYLQKLELGVRRFLKAIDIPTGTISTKLFFNPPNLPLSSVWTRVLETFPAKPGIFAKGWNWDCFSLRAQIFNFYLPSVVPSGLANLMTNQGRSFGHIAGDIADPQLYIVLTQAQINTVKGLSPDVDWAALIQAQRVGGGSFPSYPGGVAPNPCFILPTSVESQSVHASHKTFLGTLPHIDKLAPGFPAGI